MPVYRRYRRSSYRRRRYPYRRRYRRSYARRYVNASSRSSIRMKTAVTAFSSRKSGYGSTLGDVFSINPFDYSDRSLTASPLFIAYHNLYDEMKLIGMKVSVAVTDVVGNSTLPSLQIYTSWDRRYGAGESLPTATEIKSASTMNVATALNNNVAKITRSLYASDLIEKAQWIDSDLNTNNQLAAWVAAGKNPNFFAPLFSMVFGSPSLSAQTEVASVHFNVSVTYYVAFRSPKYGGSSSSKDLPVKSVTFADEPYGDADEHDGDAAMEDGDVAVVDDPVVPAARAAADPTPLTRPTASNLGEAPSIKPKGKRHHHEQKNE